jgi:putative cell wall-binding protein
MKRWLFACAAMGLALPTLAAVTLQDRNAIVETLKTKPPCCVIDGRAPTPRLIRPLKDAVIWKKGVRIKPTGTVVVVADDDKAALALGERIGKQFQAETVVAVKGGIDTWREVLAIAEEPGMPATFVIPMNTCEQGKPLQVLRAKRP